MSTGIHQVVESIQVKEGRPAEGAPQAEEAPHAEGALPDAAIDPVDAMQNVETVAKTVQDEVNLGVPALPDTEGAKALAREVQRMLSGETNDLPLNNRGMAWMAMQLMAAGSQQQLIQNARVKRAAETWRLDAKQSEIYATMDRIAGDRQKTVNLLAGSLISAVTAAGMGYFGNAMALSADGHQMAAGQALVGASQAVGNVVNNISQSVDKLAGGGRRSDDADIRSRRLARQQDIAQQVADAARSAMESARQTWQKAQQTINDMNDRRMQAINSIYR